MTGERLLDAKETTRRESSLDWRVYYALLFGLKLWNGTSLAHRCARIQRGLSPRSAYDKRDLQGT